MRRAALMVVWVLEQWLALLLAMVALAWIWTGSNGSLAHALGWAGRFLPQGQQLVAEGVQGSIRGGGQMARIRWSQPGLSVEARHVDMRWALWPLLSGRLAVRQLQAEELSIEDRRLPSAEPLGALELPMEIDLPLQVTRLHWAGPPAAQISGIRAHYRYDGTHHTLRVDSAQLARGRYQGEARLLARAPLLLALDLRGQVEVPLGERPMRLEARASLRGPLERDAGPLLLAADLQPSADSPGPPGAAPQTRAHVSARILPWAAQPVVQAEARVQQLDLSAVWPGAPRTRLTGDARIQPLGPQWQARVALDNTLPGPWDRGLLPVTAARVLGATTPAGWVIESLQAQAGGGSITLQGRLADGSADLLARDWHTQARWTGVNPSLLISRLAPARLDGSLEARTVQGALQFTVSVQPAGAQPPSSPLAGMRLQRAFARGSWGSGWLRLAEMQLQTDDALLQGPLDLQPASRSGAGEVQVRLPGAQGRLQGRIAPREGSGILALDIQDTALAAAWLRRWLPQAEAQALPDLRGQAAVALQWQGGWQDLQEGTSSRTRLQATLQSSALAIRPADPGAAPVLQLRDTRIRLEGTAADLLVSATGQMQRDAQSLALQAEARGGRLPDGDWRLLVRQLRADLQGAQRQARWSIALAEPLQVDWQRVTASGRVQTGLAQARLTGPLPGVVRLQAEPVRWTPGGALSSQGRLDGLPLDWLALLGDTALDRLGVIGTMVFDATWDVALSDTLRVRASLARRSGDLRVQADQLPGRPDGVGTVDAGVREARIDLAVDDQQVAATLRWDSERAGTARATFDTRLARSAGGWTWPVGAPLGGTVQAQLPQVGVWSLLAPPGWRMRGTLDAELQLGGNRQAPDWSGQIRADGLALRSVVDGIEFGNGRLRARMQGQRLHLETFSLQGAGGVSGGILEATGFALWVPDTGVGAASRVQIDLDATARALRVSARADRRLAVSGTLQARLRNARLAVEGALRADQALIVLPEETAPRLGDDVVVLPRRGEATSVSAATSPAPSPRTPGTVVQTTLSVLLDLGPEFRVQGRGIATRLAGQLQLRGTAGQAPQLNGEVRTAQGTYRAYGQRLDIEQGVLRFTGSVDNPALDILAVRPNLTQRVGVQITGTASVPRVRLFSEPELPEAEKLAWLVLGRSGANGGAEAAVLQQAALALLGRNGQGLSGGLASALGLDELSIAGGATRADGSTSAATVTLGKRLSRDFYVAYERSLAGTMGTISIFYDLSRRFTVRASTGEQSAIDLIFTIRYD